MGNTTMVDPYGRTDDERSAYRAALAAANQEAFENWDDHTWRREMAAEMTETIYEGFQHESILRLFANVENADFNGRVFVKEVRGLRAFWVARGGFIEASTMHAEVVEIPRDTIGFHVYEMEDSLRTSFGETQATLIDLGTQRMDAEVNRRALGIFQAAIPPSSPYYISSAGVTLAALNTALREVRDVSFANRLAIIGRATMTDQIVDLVVGANNGAGYLPETNEQLLRMGVLGQYRGANIITINNYLDDSDLPFFPGNEMFVVGPDASKFAFWGGMLSKEYSEDNDWYWHYLARRDFGGLVHRRNRLRRIVATDTAP